MAYNGAIADTLRELFSAAGILATFEDKNGVGVFTVRRKRRCRQQSAQTVVLVREDSYSTITTLPRTADTDHRLAMAEYLTRANWGMRNGNFELNMDDGEIRYKSYVHVGQEKPDMGAARLATLLPFLMIDRYGDGLIDVLFGFRTPREAFDAIQT